MAKKKSNSKKTPRTRKYAGRKPKSKNLLGKTAFNPYNHPAYAQGMKEGNAEVAAHVNKFNTGTYAIFKNEKVKNSHKRVMEKYSKAFHDLKDDAYWDGGKTDPKPCCAPPAAPVSLNRDDIAWIAPPTGWRKWVGYVVGPVSRFLKGII